MNKSFLKLGYFVFIFVMAGCATGRDLHSSHYIPEWENKFVNFPSPSETSGGQWAVRTSQKTAYAVERTLLFPFAILGNVAVNSYYIPTWPVRWVTRGDKRLLVWQPLFDVGSTAGSDFYSKEWNKDLV